MFISLNGQALAANCTAAYTHTNNGDSVNYNLNSGQSLKIASGTYTGTLNNFASGATICVETGSTFAPGNLNNAAGTLLNYGTSNLNTFSYNTGTVIDNYGTLSFLSGLNTNGATTFRNRANATMNMASSFQLGNSSSLTNDGLLLTQQDFNTQNGTTLTNNYRMEVAGNFNPSGKVDNYGRIYAKKFMNVNANSALSNYCTLVSYNGFNNNSSLMNNSGTILITTATGTPGGPWQNNQAFRNGSNARIAGGNFTNNSTFTGGGSMIFSGVTLNQGAFTGNSTSDKINFYDETQTGSQFFDSQNVTPTNTVRTAFTRPTELDAPTTCSGTYKSFALGDIYGTVYTDNNLNNTLDTTETRLPNMTVWLYDSTGVTLLQSKTTDASGVYSFTGVAAGIYQIKVDATDPDRPAGASIGTTNPLTPVTVTAGGTTANQNFGFDIAAAATKDFGDAPASYGSASHTIVSGLYLGQNPPSAETASKYSFNARADDNDDGAPRQPVVSYIPLFPILQQTDTQYSAGFTVNNTTGSAAKLFGWIDFDKSGTFEADEATFASVASGVNNGSVTLSWASIPTDIQLGTTAIRLRLTTDPAVTVNTPTGAASNGEVEDFPIAIAMHIPANSPSISIVSGATPAACEAIIFSDNFNDLSQYMVWGANRADGQPIRNWNRSGGGADTYAQIKSTMAGGSNIYFGNGGVREISPPILGGFTFDANGKLLTTIEAISLRDDMDDITPGVNNSSIGDESDWGPTPVTLSRTFTTVVGKTYRLYFKATPEEAAVSGDFVSGIMRLDMPGGSIHFRAPGSSEGVRQYAVEFTATSTSSTIGFVNYGHVLADDSGWCDPNSYYNTNPWCTVGGSNLAQGANELIIDDVVLTQAACATGTISGTVYRDTNKNNTPDAGESGIPAISVSLYDDKGTPTNPADDRLVNSASSNATGGYSFANVDTAKTYRVEVDASDVDLPLDYIPGTPNPLTGLTVGSGATTTANFGFDQYQNNYCVTPSGSTGLLNLGSMSTTNITGSGTFTYLDRVLPGYGTVDVVLSMSGGIHNANTSAIDSGGKQVSWLNQGLTAAGVSASAIYLGPNSGGTATVTYNFDQPTGNVDLLVLDVDYEDTLTITALDGAGNAITDFSGWRYRSGDMSTWQSTTLMDAAPPAWNAATATLTSTDVDNNHRSFGLLTPNTLVTKIVVTFAVPAVSGRHVYTSLFTTASGRDGEVSCTGGSDFGDAPASYGTPSHTILNSLRLGTLAPDSETASQPSATANLDDTTGTDDEDAVASFPGLIAGATSYSLSAIPLTNSTGTPATLYGWIDFNRNGRFDGNEAATATVASGATSASLNWAGLTGITAGASYVRLRLTTQALTNTNSGTLTSLDTRSTSTASNGEVEDYALTVGAAVSTPVAVGEFRFDDCSSNGSWNLDSSGNGNNATGTPTAIIADYKAYGCTSVRNNSWNMEVPHIPAYELASGAVSILMYDNQNIWPSARLLDKGWTATDKINLTIKQAGDDTHGTISANLNGNVIDTGETFFTTRNDGSQDDGQWTHVVLTFGAQGMKLYINGVLKGSNPYTGGMNTAQGTFRMAEPFGFVDEFYILNGQPTDAQVQGIYTNLLANKNLDGSDRSCGCKAISSAMSGTVYTDSNGNNSFDAGAETGIGAITVSLRKVTDNSVVATTSTAANGTYSFTGVDATLSYKIQVDTADTDLPVGAVIGTTNPLTPVTVTAGGTTANQNFGFDLPSTQTISGKVFDDVNYGGGAGRVFGTAGTAGVSGARVEVYTAAGSFLSSTTTAADGAYTLSSLSSGNYYVRVVNDTVKSTRTGSNGTERGIQIYRTDGTTAVTNEVGGRKPVGVDSAANTTSQTLNTTTFTLSGGGQVQSVQPITVAGSAISGANFGFNFDTIVNTNDSGQGSLRQFILNAVLLGSDSTLAQTGRTAAKENAILELSTSDPNYNATHQYWSIAVQSELPTLGDDIILDGSTQPSRTNFAFANRPVIELNGSGTAGTWANGLRLNGATNGSTIKYLAINRFDNAGIKLVNSKNNLIEANYIGTDPTATTNNIGNTGHGVNVISPVGLSVIRGNLIAHNYGDGVTVWNFNGVGVDEAALISSNSIYANLGLGIDLIDNDVTLNDANDADTGPNKLLNFPILSQLTSASGNLTLKGCAPAGATVELFEADVSPGGAATVGANTFGLSKDYGEGQTYLASFVEGSAADTDSSNCALPTDADGNNQTGMKAFSVTLPVPAGFVTGDAMTTTATLATSGTSEFSPVMSFTSTAATDYGDAPESYHIQQSNNGASHTIVADFHLGVTVDGEADGQPTAAADGDGADEDGVHFITPLLPGESALIAVGTTQTSVATAYLNGWIDFNHDGDFADANEHIITDQTIASVYTTLALLANIPADAIPGDTYARFRLSSTSGTSYDGAAADGEVEDYKVTIATPSRVGDTVWLDTNQNGIQDAGEAGVPGVTVKLYRKSDNRLLGAKLTDSTGNYFFANELAAGTYYLEFTKPAGYQFTLQGAGTDPALNSDADPTTGRTGDITVVAGIPQTQWDAGLIANALVVTQCQAIPFSTTQVDHSFSVPKFDGALGTLTGVQVNAYSGIKQIWAIENRSTSASNFRITSTMPASFTLPNASSLALDYSYNSGIFSIPAFDGVTDYAGTSGKSLDAWRYEGSAVSNNYTPTADFVAASAGESITLPYSSGMGSMSLVGGGGNALFTIRTQASAGVCVNYTYTPPPQPPLGCSVLDNFDSASVETIGLTSSSQGPVTQTWNANVDGLIGGARTLTLGPAPRGTATNGYGLLDIANNAGTAANMKLCYNANGAGLNVNVSQIENILLNVMEDEHHNPDAATRANIPMTITLSDGFNSASLTQDMVSLAYQQLGTTDGWANLRFPLANFTNINSLNRNNVQSVCIEVAGKQGHDYAFEKVMLEDTNTCSSVTGKVFEDVNYGGGAGRALSSATNAQGVNGARLELYSNSGKLIESTNSYSDASNGAGTYTFAALTSGDYYVRAVSDTVNSSRSGANGTEVGVMTYRTDGITPTTTEVGGRKPNGVDAGVNDRETILNTGTFTFNGGTLNNQPAQAVQPVTLSSSNPNAVNFGFNFSTIVNTNNAGQGSLRQFLVNNSLLSSAGLAQVLPASLAGIYPVGSDISIFMIPPSQLTAGEALITLNSMLTLNRAYAAIDGRTQLANQGSGAVVLTGSGAGVGSDGLLLTENADHAAVRDISLRNFNGSGVIFAGADESVLERTTVSGNADYGVYLQADANSNQLLENTITGNGLSGIAQRTGVGNTFSRNSLTGNSGLGIDLDLDGVTANDAGDGDSGSNNLLNYPEIVVGSSISTNGSKVVTYDFDLDVPGNTHGYRIEFFSNTTPDASGHGEGEVYLGYKDIIHNGGGSQNFKGVFNANQPVAENANIAVTVTEKTSASTLGSTSEFSGVRDGNVSVCTDLINGDGINAVINENSAIITMLEATDALGNPITYVISGGADGSLFMIIDPVLGAEFDCSTLVFKTEVIETRASAINKAGPLLPPPGDYEAPRDSGGDNIYDLIITAIDSQGHSVSKPVTVAVNNVNEKPVITSVSRTEIKEGQSGVVLAVSAYDPDTVDQNDAGLVYSLGYAGADGSRFTLDKTTGELRFVKTPDFEAPADSNHDNVYELELGVTDKAGYSSFSNLSVVVTDDKSEGVSLSARVLLQGAYESKTGLMQDDLRTTGVLPVAQPYTLAPFAYAGTEQINLDLVTPTGADAIVDWVLLELRAANTPTTILARKAVLVQRDGDLVDAQTGQTQQVFAGLPDGNYQVSVRHRNHLGVMTAASVALTSANTLLDFTLAATPVQGQNARYVNGTLALLWAGDIQHDERLILDGVGNDRNQILSAVLLSKSNTGLNSNYRLSGYQPSDLNMNGETVFMGPGSDTNVLLGNVLLYPGNTKALSNFIVNGGMRE